MQIQVIPRDCGGTEFIAQPHRLHLGAQSAEGIDTLELDLDALQGDRVELENLHAVLAEAQTRAAARQAASNSSMSNSYASRAEAAALQAESYANELKGMLGGA